MHGLPKITISCSIFNARLHHLARDSIEDSDNSSTPEQQEAELPAKKEKVE